MAFATNALRLLLIKGCAYPLEFSVQIEARNGVELELSADDIDHALAMSADWLKRGARWVEVFRVNPHDGSLIPTIGRVSASGPVVEAPPAPKPATLLDAIRNPSLRRQAAIQLEDRIALDMPDELSRKVSEIAPESRKFLYTLIALTLSNQEFQA